MVAKSDQKKGADEKEGRIPFDEALRRMINTPPKPRKSEGRKKGGGRRPKSAKTSS